MSLTETRNDLLKDLGIDENATIPNLDVMSNGETRFLRDLRINVKNVLGSERLTPKEAYLLAASVAINEKNKSLSSLRLLKIMEALSEKRQPVRLINLSKELGLTQATVFR